MDLTITTYLLVAESIFFSALLVACLKMASNKHHSHLKKLMELITKSEEKTKAIAAEKKSIEETRKQLSDKINGLHKKIDDLEKTKKKYELLKEKHEDLKNTYETLKNETEDNNTNENITGQESTIVELQETITNLEKTIEDLSISKNSHENKDENSDRSPIPDESYDSTLNKLNEELDYYKNRVFELEKISNDNSPPKDKSKYKIISKASKQDKSNSTHENETEELRKEINSLRESSADQRKIIFDLEKQINQLKTETSIKDISNELKAEKENEMSSLTRTLNEAEGCVNILENEIEALKEKLANLEKVKYDDTNENHTTNATSQPQKNISIGTQIKNIISSAQSASVDTTLELITTEILDAIEPSNLDVFLKIKSTLGEIEVSAKDDWSVDDTSAIEERLNNDGFFSETNGNVLRMGDYHIAILATHEDAEKAETISDFEEALSVIILVSNTIIDLLEKREKNTNKVYEFKKVVDTVRTDAQKISIQQNYQTAEAQRIIDTFLVDLNNSLNTMNITEHQSAFFDAMIQEARGRMDLLLSTRSSVESDFTTMIGKLEKNGTALLH